MDFSKILIIWSCLSNKNHFSYSQFCVSYRGDSGGPAFRFDRLNGDASVRRYILFGSVHGSVESCSSRYPGIFVRIADEEILEFVRNLGEKSGKTIYTASDNGTPYFTYLQLWLVKMESQ